MKTTAHNLQTKTGSVLSFVVWSKRGEGMVNIYCPGPNNDGGIMKSIADARAYWRLMVEKHGYIRSESTTVDI